MDGSEQPPGIERRKAPRVDMPPEGGVVAVVGARLLNVSTHGMLIESLVALEAESVHQFRLKVAGENLDVEARVAACHRLDFGQRRFRVGMEFVRMSDADHARIGAAIQPLV